MKMAAKKAAEPKKAPAKSAAYKVEGDKVVRSKPVCPKCGPGVFMATHGDRVACDKCGYTEFKKE